MHCPPPGFVGATLDDVETSLAKSKKELADLEKRAKQLTERAAKTNDVYDRIRAQDLKAQQERLRQRMEQEKIRAKMRSREDDGIGLHALAATLALGGIVVYVVSKGKKRRPII